MRIHVSCNLSAACEEGSNHRKHKRHKRADSYVPLVLFVVTSLLAFVLQNVQACIPVADIHESISRDIDIGSLGCERNVRARIDQSLRRRWLPICDFLWRECVLDIKHTYAGIVVSGEDRLLATKAARPVF